MKKTIYKTAILALSIVLITTLGFIFGNKSTKIHKAEMEQTKTANIEKSTGNNLEKATFGAGCFWGVEETFAGVKGVKSTAVGYMGGTMDNPTYQDVCTDETGHAEVVYLEYDPSEVNYDDLLKIFWENHNPTTMNRQGPDIGTQYRSVVFYYNDEQKAAAEKSKDELQKSGKFTRDIVTQIIPASTFWRAEEYHQKYLQKHGLSHCNY